MGKVPFCCHFVSQLHQFVLLLKKQTNNEKYFAVVAYLLNSRVAPFLQCGRNAKLHILTHSLTYLLSYSLTYSLTYLLIYLLTYLLTYLFTYLLTHLLTYLLITYLLTYSFHGAESFLSS